MDRLNIIQRFIFKILYNLKCKSWKNYKRLCLLDQMMHWMIHPIVKFKFTIHTFLCYHEFKKDPNVMSKTEIKGMIDEIKYLRGEDVTIKTNKNK